MSEPDGVVDDLSLRYAIHDTRSGLCADREL
jgi:hypothetical protein